MRRTRMAIAAASMLAAWLLVGCRREQPAGSRPPASQAASQPAPPEPGHAVTNSIGMRLVYVPPGEFMMGSPLDEPGRHDDEPRRRVTIGRGFYLGCTEVTQAQYRAVIGFNPSHPQGDDLPVLRVSWTSAAAFCKKLSRKDGRTCRLPTEAEWEYACRAGSTAAVAGTGQVDEMGWHMDNSGERPHPVAGKKPNAWGLFDMHGNVMEWCADRYARGGSTAPATGALRVARGGSWGHFARACRSAARVGFNAAYQLDRVGFRVLMELPPAASAAASAKQIRTNGSCALIGGRPWLKTTRRRR
jgi:formylglycine-generating enzyme required for sulfatase activity